jgi:3-methyl-2-oxobutanoate hydroxymethyltransferase
LLQILIAPDILGLTQGVTPEFVKSYGCLAESTIEAFAGYAKEIQDVQFPDKEHSYHMKAGELERLKKLL